MDYAIPVLVVLASVLLAIDWRQTITIAKNPDKWHEKNPILGEHPTTMRVNIYFAVCAICVAIGIYFLPQTWAIVGLGVLCVVEIYAVFNNFRIGIYPWAGKQ